MSHAESQPTAINEPNVAEEIGPDRDEVDEEAVFSSVEDELKTLQLQQEEIMQRLKELEVKNKKEQREVLGQTLPYSMNHSPQSSAATVSINRLPQSADRCLKTPKPSEWKFERKCAVVDYAFRVVVRLYGYTLGHNVFDQ